MARPPVDQSTAGVLSIAMRPASKPADEQGTAIFGLGVFCLTTATFLAPYVTWRLSFIFVSASDILFAAGGAFLVTSGRMLIQPIGILATIWMLAVTAMLGGLFLASVTGGDPAAWVTAACQYTFAYLMIPAVLILGGGGLSLRLARASVAGVVVLEAAGVLMYFLFDGSHDAVTFLAPDFVSGARRLGSFTSEANWNGAVITMAFPLALYLRSRGLMSSRWMIVVAAALISGLILSASVTAMIATTVALMIFSMVGRVGPSRGTCLLLGGVAGTLSWFGAGLPQAFGIRVGRAVESGDIQDAGTFSGRVDLINEAWGLVDDHLLLGMGMDQYRHVSPLGAPVHNMYLLLWAEGGLMALLGWVTMMGVLVLACVAMCTVDRLRAALGGSVLAAFFIFSAATPHMYARIWVVPLMIALAVMMDRFSMPARPAPSVPGRGGGYAK